MKVELAYALGYAERAPSNESPWNYVRGFFQAGGRSYADFPEVKERALALQVSQRLLGRRLRSAFLTCKPDRSAKNHTVTNMALKFYN